MDMPLTRNEWISEFLLRLTELAVIAGHHPVVAGTAYRFGAHVVRIEPASDGPDSLVVTIARGIDNAPTENTFIRKFSLAADDPRAGAQLVWQRLELEA